MIGLARFVVCSTLLVAGPAMAWADSVTVTGNVTFTQDFLTFAPPFATPSASGSVGAGFTNGTVNYMLGTVGYTQGLYQTAEAFTITAANGDVLSFYDEVNTPIQSYDANGNLQVTLDETGFYILNGGPEMTGTFDLSFVGTSPEGATSNVAFSGTGEFTPIATAVTPEPASLLMLGTGLFGGTMMMRRRQKV